ncbi:MAG TPA: AAA family ATPase, partial [Allocoleopsis sp.]
MLNRLFIPPRLIGRTAELQQISQILSQDGDFLLVGSSGIGRRTLIHAAAHQAKARVLEIDCLRTTSGSRLLRLLADSLLDAFWQSAELNLIEEWSRAYPIVLEHRESQRPRLVWHGSAQQEWIVLQTLLALPQKLAEWLDCRVVIVFLNFPHIRSWDRSGTWEDYLRQEIQQQSRVSYALVSTAPEAAWVQDNQLPVIALGPLDDQTMTEWIVPAMAEAGLRFDPDSGAIDLF